MQVNTLIGALIAALVLLFSSLVTLFMENPELTFGMIRQSTWVSIVGGALVAFLKDFQAISTRRFINRATKAGDGGGSVNGKEQS